MVRRASSRFALVAVAALVLSLLGMAPASAVTFSEQQGSRGANTFLNHHNASGVGPRIDPRAWVDVSCKVYDPYIGTANPDGYWYRIASAPWNDQYYAIANTFMNGDPWGGPYTHNTDFNVPDCGAAPTPAPAPSVTLSQGPAAPAGYRYAVTLNNFAANSSVSISCYDSVSPGGFYTFTLATDGSGSASTASYCYSGDGPDHWVVANGVESNHVSWGASTAPPPVTSPPVSSPVVTLAQGPQAPNGYRYAITLDGFAANSSVAITCHDSVSPGGFYPFNLTTDGSGHASSAAYCYSGDGPDHWVVAGGVESNHVAWGAAPAPNPAPVPVPDPGTGHTVINGIDVGVAQNQPHTWGPCTVQDFRDGPHGWVIVSYTNGTHLVRNGMLWGWFDNGGAPGFGCPTNDEHQTNYRITQDFTDGTLYWVSGMSHAKKLRAYIALGDSYSSGEANPPFDAGTDVKGVDTCHRSSEAWPRILSRLKASGVKLVGHFACSGATTAALTSYFKSEAPQLDQLAQAPHADVITVTFGGNDLGFKDLLQLCVLQSFDCLGGTSWAEYKLRHPYIYGPSVLARVTQALRQVQAISPTSRIVLVGYPNIFPPDQNKKVHCAWLSRSERASLVQLATDFDATSRDAAQAAGVEYLSLLHTLAGHEECTSDSWMYPIAAPGSATQYNGHPSALGQFAMARAVQDYLGSWPLTVKQFKRPNADYGKHGKYHEEHAAVERAPHSNLGQRLGWTKCRHCC